MNLDFRTTLQILLVTLVMALVVVCMGMAFDLTTVNQEKLELVLSALAGCSAVCLISLGLTYLE